MLSGRGECSVLQHGKRVLVAGGSSRGSRGPGCGAGGVALGSRLGFAWGKGSTPATVTATAAATWTWTWTARGLARFVVALACATTHGRSSMACVCVCVNVCAHVQQHPRIYGDRLRHGTHPLLHARFKTAPRVLSLRQPSQGRERNRRLLCLGRGVLGSLLRPLSTPKLKLPAVLHSAISASGSCIPQSQSQSQSIKSTLISTICRHLDSCSVLCYAMRPVLCKGKKKGGI
jgi:hypothetical protein